MYNNNIILLIGKEHYGSGQDVYLLYYYKAVPDRQQTEQINYLRYLS